MKIEYDKKRNKIIVIPDKKDAVICNKDKKPIAVFSKEFLGEKFIKEMVKETTRRLNLEETIELVIGG